MQHNVTFHQDIRCLLKQKRLSVGPIADVVEAFNSISRYLDGLLNIDSPYFEQMVGQIYPTKLQLNKANSSDTEVPFLDLDLSITNGIVSSKIYDKMDDCNVEIVIFPFFDGDIPVYIRCKKTVFVVEVINIRTYSRKTNNY